MPYKGASIPIPLGALGLKTDDADSSLPANALIKANNVSLYSGKIEKSRGTTKYNTTALSASIVAIHDWFPTPSLQRLIVATSDGKLFRDTGDTTFNTQTAITSGLGVLTTDTHMAEGGAESSGRNKKLFVATGTSQIQILSGDGSSTTAVSNPASDWSAGNYPTFVINYQNRMIALGSPADRHRVYASFEDDHENFLGKASTLDLTNAQWQLWSLQPGAVDVTATAQLNGLITIFPTTNNYGWILQGSRQFNKVTFVVTQAQAGTPVYTYEYWNGSSWVALTLTATPSYASTGAKTMTFAIPTDWFPGDGAEVSTDGLYSIRMKGTTAPSTAVIAKTFVLQNTTLDLFPYTTPVFPGKGDGIIGAAIYRGLLFLFKKPQGVYILDGRDPNTTNWTVKEYSTAFGVGSPHATLEVLGDLIAANSFGSYTSLQASDTSGDFEAGDILDNLSILKYINEQFDKGGITKSQSIYYPHKKIAMFTAQSSPTDVRDRILMIDVKKSPSRATIETKENPNCLALRKDSQGILRPMYGDKNGFVFLMDQNTYSVNGAAFIGEFQTPSTDFSFADPKLADKSKIFDFLSVSYVSTGNNNFYVDVYIDSTFKQTLTFPQQYGVGLDSFILDVSRLAGGPTSSKRRKKLDSATGNKISFRFYNNSVNEAFMIERIIVSFRLSGEESYVGQT